MVRFIAENNIENPVEIQKFDRLRYSFRSDLSSDSEYGPETQNKIVIQVKKMLSFRHILL